MKKTFFALAVVVLFTSCEGNSYGKVKQLGSGFYETTTQTKNGDGTPVDVKFWIEGKLIDSLNIPQDEIIRMCTEATRWADFGCNYPLTYKHDVMSMLMFNENESNVEVMMMGSAQNAYGVPDRVATHIEFDKANQMVVDSIWMN